MTVPNLFLAISFVTNFGLGFFILLRSLGDVKKKINVVFSLVCFAGALWILTALMISTSKVMDLKLFWIRSLFGVSAFIAPTFLHFCLIFPRYQHDIDRVKTGLLYFPAVVFLALSQTRFIVDSIVQMEPSVYDYGFLYTFFSFYMIGCLGIGLYVLVRTYAKSTGINRLQIKYCLLGMLVTIVAALSTNIFLPFLGSSKYSKIGPSFTIIHVAFTTYAIVKHRLMDINVVLKKGTTFFLLLLLLFVPSFALILIAQKLFFMKIDYVYSAFALALLFLVAFFFQKIKPRTEKAVEHLFFKDKYNYRETLGKLTKAMVTILDLQSLCKRIIETITHTMGVEKASFFILNEEREEYELIESKNLEETAVQNLKQVSLSDWQDGEIYRPWSNRRSSAHSGDRKVIDQMSVLGAEVTIPLISKGHLIGMINLSHKFNKDIYSHEDIELLSTLANQTAIAIENARLYEDLKKSKSYMRRADRLASLGTLTAGLAHEIRNPLVAIKTFTQLLPERLEDEEFRNHFLAIASGEVDRISSLINELLEFARPSNPKLEPEDVNSILDGMILLVSTETKKRHIEITKAYSVDLPLIKIDREQIKQVFLNFLLNAIEATPENGRITVRTRSFLKPGGDPYVQIEITDTGCGIPKEYLEEIFNPFFTTKDKGSGLGLSISSQIIQDHKGYITVESQLNQGSSFFINVPLNQETPKRRRDDMEEDSQHAASSLEQT